MPCTPKIHSFWVSRSSAATSPLPVSPWSLYSCSVFPSPLPKLFLGLSGPSPLPSAHFFISLQSATLYPTLNIFNLVKRALCIPGALPGHSPTGKTPAHGFALPRGTTVGLCRSWQSTWMRAVNLAASCSQLTKFEVQGCLLVPGVFLAIAMLSAYSFGCRAMGVVMQPLLQCSRASTDKASQMYLISTFHGAVQ